MTYFEPKDSMARK